MPKKINILIVDDNAADAALVAHELERINLQVQITRAHSRESFAREFARFPDLILTDFSMPGFGAIELLRIVRDSHTDIPVMIISGTIGEDAAVDAMKHGAVDYLLKDRLGRLGPAIERVLENRRLSRERREADALMRIVGRVARIGAWAVDLAEKRIMWTDEVRELHEVDASYVPTLEDAINFYAPESRPAIEAAVKACIESGAPYDLELQLITARGRRIWVRAIGEAEREPSGLIRRIQGAFQDISELKKATEQVGQLANQLVTTLESITDAFFTVDLQWRFNYINKEAERLLRRPRADLLGKSLWTEFPDALGTTFEREYRRAMTEFVSVGFEECYAPLEFWVDVRAYPSNQGLTVYFRDVTERRRAEEERAAALLRERAARQEADAAKSHFRTLFEFIPGLFLVVTPEEYRIVEVSEEYLKATRTKRDALIGRRLFEVFPENPKDTDADGARNLRASFERVKQTGAADTMAVQRYPIPAEGGGFEERYWSPFNSPVFGSNGELAYLIHRVEDVTEFVRLAQREGTWEQGRRKLTSKLERMEVDLILRAQEVIKLNEKLRASEEHYRLLFDRNPQPMWAFDLETKKFLAVNIAALTKYGYTEEEFLSMSIEELRPAEDVPRLRAAMEGATTGKNVGVWRHRTKSGEIIDVEIHADTIVFETRPARLILANDITERLRAQERIAQQAALIDQANDAIIVRDFNHTIQFWSKGAERLYGWTAEEAISQKEHELVHGNTEQFAEAVRRLLSTGEWRGEIEQKTKEGRSIVVSASWSLLRDAAGEPHAILAIKSDVTERKKIEAQFLRAQRLESIGTLAGGIAHDLNNLLSPIIMGVGLLKLSPLSPRDQSIISKIQCSAERGTNLVRQVLSFARGVEGAKVTLNVRHLMSEVELIVADTFPRNITLTTEFAKDTGLVTGDPTQLNQVLLNLCVNARDAMPRGGRITITAKNEHIDEQYAATHRSVTPGAFVAIEVADTGTGIPKDIIDKIFEPFFTTKEHGKGTGLGLSTTIGIVRSHGGFVTVYSEVGSGTVFKVYLPVHADAEPGSGNEPDRTHAELPRGKGEWLLFVDDESNIRAITQQTLEAFGYRVLAAEDGADAIGQFVANKDKIRAVITDLMMPVMDGHGLIAAVRRIAPNMPVIATSGLQANAEVIKASNAGVQHFIAKPFSAEALLQLVRGVLDSSAEPRDVGN
jgi:PAS domain S-box-containing protein